MRTSERGRFLTEWGLLVAGLLLGSLLICGAQYREYSDIDRREREHLSTQAGIINKNVSRSLLVVERALSNLSDELSARAREKNGMAQVSRQLRTITDVMRTVLALTVLDARGRVIAANRPELLGQDFSQQP